jgi:dTDP-4-amino-4,6-dideoxygalactose transaminase
MTPYKELEKKFAEFVGTDYAVAVNTGTAALHLSLVALGIGKGDEVIVPDFSMAAAAFAVAYTGATPVFVDCDNRLLIDTKLIEKAITPKTKAILPVHIYGRVCDMKEINRIAKKHNLKIIEDACEVHGAKVGPADAICFSFYKNKIVHAEEGGIICTNSIELCDRLNYLKSMAFDENHSYYHADIGFNYRMPDSQALLALESLKNVHKNLEKRRKIASWYDEYIPKVLQIGDREVVWVYDFQTFEAEDIVEVIPGARHFFKPMSSLPPFRKASVSPMALWWSKNGCYLPVNPEMTKAEVKKICESAII